MSSEGHATLRGWPAHPEYGRRLKQLEQSLLAYAEITSNITGITGLADVITVLVEGVPEGRRLRVMAHVASLSSSVSTDRSNIRLRRGTTTIQQHLQRFTGTNAEGGATVVAYDTPPAGTYTYRVSAERLGTGTMSFNAASSNPAFISIEDVGPA